MPPHEIPRFLAQCPLQSSQRILLDALVDWATLTVDPTGRHVPAYRLSASAELCPHSHAQRQQWSAQIRLCYDSVLELMRVPRATLSAPSAAKAQDTLAQVASLDVGSVPRRYPFERPVDISVAGRDEERVVAHTLTGFMQRSSAAEAMALVAAVAVEWLRQLPEEQAGALRQALYERDTRAAWSAEEVRCSALEAIAIALQEAPA